MYTSAELDFYACLNEFDEGVGTVIDALKRLGYYDNTMIWFTTDNVIYMFICYILASSSTTSYVLADCTLIV